MSTTGSILFKLDRIESSMHNMVLYRIETQLPFKCCGVEIPTGTRGGLVAHESNIDQYSWLDEGSIVVDNSKIKGCHIKRGCYIKDNAVIDGHKRFSLGGNSGNVTIGGNVKLDMDMDIDMGPISIIDGDITLTSKKDIVYIGGVISPMYGDGITAWKSKNGIKIGIAGEYIPLEELFDGFVNSYMYNRTAKDILKISKTLTSTIKAIID